MDQAGKDRTPCVDNGEGSREAPRALWILRGERQQPRDRSIPARSAEDTAQMAESAKPKAKLHMGGVPGDAEDIQAARAANPSRPISRARCEVQSEEPCALIVHARFCEGQGPTGAWTRYCGTAGKPGGKQRTQTSTCSAGRNLPTRPGECRRQLNFHTFDADEAGFAIGPGTKMHG